MIGGAKGIGLGIDLGLVNQYNRTGSQSYIEPEVLDSLVGVWSAYGMTNDSPNRSIIKNKLSNKGGDFVISNAAFKLNSGFGKYEISLTDSITPARGAKVTDNSIEVVDDTFISSWIYYSKIESAEINSYSIEISGMPEGKLVQYWYNNKEGVTSRFDIKEDGIYTLPQSYVPADTGSNKTIGLRVQGSQSQNFVGFKVRIIPSFEGAFVTDGVDDLITSTKTVQEMGITDEVTVVSMIHQIDKPSNFITTNNIRTSGSVVGRNAISLTDKTGIYGWYKDNIQGSTINVINNILGDKADYTASASSDTNLSSKFSVVGHISNDSINETSSVAWYWTIIANKVLTTDQINQVIAYFNLDRTLKPDILCDVKKQGITNDNHAEFGDKLIDFSGNGRDIQLNNLAWKGGSGIAAKPFETIKDYTIIPDEAIQKLTIYNEFSYKIKSNTPHHYWTVQSIIRDYTSYQVTIITDKDCYWVNSTSFTNSEGNEDFIRREYLVKANTPTQVTICGLNEFEYPEGIEPTTAVSRISLNYAGEITVTFIPSYKGGLLLDGVNDFGKVTGMPIYKDYTVVADREIIDGLVENADGGVALKGSRYLTGAFCFDYKDAAFSFGTPNMIPLDTKRFISYQSKYVSNGISINIGTATDNDELWIGRLGNDKRYSKIAIRFLMSFPYSMSEFLIERQLKKHKLGTLYPDMVEFRPIVKSNLPYSSISYSVNPGEYISVDSMVNITVTLPNTSDKLMEVSCNAISDISISGDNGVYEITGKVVKSPQKINLVISSYLTMLSNSTLISNETLIKNE